MRDDHVRNSRAAARITLNAALALACLTTVGDAQTASTVYVATDGSDSAGNGSAQQPWASIEMALRNAEDGATVLVRPGTYEGRIRLRMAKPLQKGVTIRSEIPYAARLRSSNDTVITCYETCNDITLEGFDIAHAREGTDGRIIVVHIDGQGGGAGARVVLRNNIFHDSAGNDLLKINNGAKQVTVEGNVFYNQGKDDEHIDIDSAVDVWVQDNILFNDFAGSGVPVPESRSFIVVKSGDEAIAQGIGSERITIRRNVFANWQGAEGAGFLLVGEDGKSIYEARDVQVENNLMIGNSSDVMRAPFGVKGARDVMFRNNTITGDFPARAFALRINLESANQINRNFIFVNNVWSDPTGSMGETGLGTEVRFAEVPAGEAVDIVFDNNLYWNGGMPLPQSGSDAINTADDTRGVLSDPGFAPQDQFIAPRWMEDENRFADGSATIRDSFERLVQLYGTPRAKTVVMDKALPYFAPQDDILRRPRSSGGAPDLGALEILAND